MGSCPLCRQNSAIRLFQSRDRVHHLAGIFTIFRCQQCRAIFIGPWPSNEELAAYYPEHYGPYRHSRSLEKQNCVGLKRFVLEHFYGYPLVQSRSRSLLKARIAFLLSYVTAKGTIPYRGSGYFLDVGCGGGSYLHRLKQRGWNVYGVEPSAAGTAQARSLGINVCHGYIEDARFPDGFFDVIRLHHVLEHLTAPQATLREIARILKPDGLVYVTVPNTQSFNFWLFGANWYALDAPCHVISYCPKSLAFLCQATGFEILKVRYQSGAFNFVRSVRYHLEEQGKQWPRWVHGINWPSNKLIRRALKPFFLLMDRFRLGDVMLALLQKRVSSVS